MSLHPKDGVRILLELSVIPDHGGAIYRGAIFIPELCFNYDVRVDAAGAVTVAPDFDPLAPARAQELLRSITRTVAKHALAESPPRWPRRVLRWRRI